MARIGSGFLSVESAKSAVRSFWLRLAARCLCGIIASCSPPVVFADLEHRGQNVVPGLLLHHDIIWEHAAIPANVFEFLRHFALVVAHPITSVAGNVQFAIGISRE